MRRNLRKVGQIYFFLIYFTKICAFWDDLDKTYMVNRQLQIAWIEGVAIRSPLLNFAILCEEIFVRLVKKTFF
jgi:hypothetical protein